MSKNTVEAKLKWSLFFAEHDYRIHLLPPNSKLPEAGAEWKKDATCDPAIIRQWWKDFPEYNYLVAPKRGFFTSDLDVKGGRDGIKDLTTLQDLYGDLPDTLTVRTPSKGLHIFYEGTAPASVA